MKTTMATLKDGLKVQDSSAKIMSFLVQDFLDYAQIKSGNFRTNIRPFDAREMIEKVICIQREKAEDSGLDLKSIFVNLKEDDVILDGIMDELSKIGAVKRFSPIIYTDEQRVMQVLLNLQSNALKFTRKGGVTHTVEIVEE